MTPIQLILKNFTCHVKSIIDFTQFSSAVIIGQGENNTRRSNGVGKSKIFTGINYALFNQSSFNNIENVIRDAADKCKVTFTFETNGAIYKVERSRGRKANSADVRLYKKNDLNWEDLTERTPSGTERALLKIVNLNYKTFTNSVHFGQGDLTGLALLTAGDRKALLKEALQLHVYSALEKVTKKHLTTFTQDISKTKAVLSTFEGIEARIFSLNEELKNTNNEVFVAEANLTTDQQEIDVCDAKLLSILERDKVLKSEYDTINQKVSELTAVTTGLVTSKAQSSSIRADLKNEFLKKKQDLITSHNQLKTHLDKEVPNTDSLQTEQDSVSKDILEKTSSIKALQAKIKEKNTPLPDGPQCDQCLQTISEEHRDTCKAKLEDQISTWQKSIINLNTEVQFLNDRLKVIVLQIKIGEQHFRDLATFQREVTTKEKELDVIKDKYQSFDKKFKEFDDQVKEKETELELWKSSHAVFMSEKYAEYNALSSQVTDVQKERGKALLSLKVKQEVLAKGKLTCGVLQDRLAKCDEELVKRDEHSKKLLKTEDDFNLHVAVAQAFGSKGIPALIIHNMLDDLQIHANNIIAQIRPGLQLEFEIDKENKKGEQSDTLDIKYTLNSREREFDQLSGAQKLVVTLGLRLGLSLVIQKSFGIDIKFLLLDEVDAALDEESLDAFIDLIRVIEKDFKVLVITHKNNLKDKFSHAILVEQDQNMNSTAKVMDM